MFKHAVCTLALALGCAIQASASIPTHFSSIDSSPWYTQLWSLPVFSWFTTSPTEVLHLSEYLPIPPAEPPCLVEPLPVMTDLEAMAFEVSRGTAGVIQTDGLTPATATALTRFASIVTSAGGTVTVTSAYRPPAYQAHLQAVWDKWMLELRDLHVGQCNELRSNVEREFIEHGLLETQRPAPVSDHTRGMAFDAVVLLPSHGVRSRRRISTDVLARRAGLFRPVAFQDPVHFRLRIKRS